MQMSKIKVVLCKYLVKIQRNIIINNQILILIL